MSIGDRRRYRGLRKRLPEWCLDKNFKPLQHETDSFSTWTDRAVATPAEDSDPRMAEDSLNPEKPRGM
jgi:hypothetical protein